MLLRVELLAPLKAVEEAVAEVAERLVVHQARAFAAAEPQGELPAGDRHLHGLRKKI